jgi:hypothetical protein
MVKEREGEATPWIDLRVEESGTPEAFETRLSEACGAVLDLERRFVPFRLRIGDRICAEAHDPDRRSKALEALAIARFDPASTAPPNPATSPMARDGQVPRKPWMA